MCVCVCVCRWVEGREACATSFSLMRMGVKVRKIHVGKESTNGD